MIEAFQRDGYVVVDDVFTINELVDLALALAKVLDLPRDLPIAELYDTAFRLPEFLRLTCKREFCSTAKELLGMGRHRPLYAHANRIIIAPPGDERRTWGWHRETQYTIPGSHFIQTWFPLVHDSSDEDGALQVCPGSHLDTDPGERWIEEPERARQCVVSDAAVARYTPISVPMRLGQCMFFDSRLFHRSGVNTSTRIRWSGVVMFHDVEHPNFKPAAVRYEYR